MDAGFRRAIGKARRQRGLYFSSLLCADRISAAFANARCVWSASIYTPAITVWVYLSQCLSQDHSCREAVAGLIAWRLARGERACSPETGAYCIARDKIPEDVCRQLLRETGQSTDEESPSEWRWLGHRVRAVDGSTVTMPDTAANRQEHTQPPGQARGCGFPIARIVVVFSLAVGTVLEAALGKYEGKQTGENSMFRAMHEILREGDVVLQDRYFSGWFDIALVRRRGAHVVVRKHQLRPTDFRTGRRLGRDDHIVSWVKPARPKWMTKEEYATLPEELQVREVRVRVPARKGFRVRELVVVTTLLDAEKYSASAIGELYRRRWQAELNLRSLKTVMQMDHLRCKTPERVRNEFYMHLIAYNLIRQMIAMAAFEARKEPWMISFKGALQTMTKMLPLLESHVCIDSWCDALLRAIGAHEVGNRPDRVEPRVRKRRPKEYPLMIKPRHQYKRRMAKDITTN